MTQRIDATTGADQCKATTRNGSDGYLCCRFVAGHPGRHKTVYVNGHEWDEPFNCAPPSLDGYRVLCPCGAFGKRAFLGYCSERCRDERATPPISNLPKKGNG